MALVKLITPSNQEVGIEPAHVVLVLPAGSVNGVQRWQVCHVGGGMFEVDFDGDLIDFINGQQIDGTTELIEGDGLLVEHRGSPVASKVTKAKK